MTWNLNAILTIVSIALSTVGGLVIYAIRAQLMLEIVQLKLAFTQTFVSQDALDRRFEGLEKRLSELTSEIHSLRSSIDRRGRPSREES